MQVDLTLVLLGVLAFTLGGFSKGLTGIGLPMIGVPILSLLLGVPQAMALMIVPIIATNLLQAFRGGRLNTVLRRFWPLMASLVVSLYFATYLLGRLSDGTLLVITGSTLLGSTLLMWRAPAIELSPALERRVGIAVGLFAGALGGLTGLAGGPVVLYMIGLGLSKERFQAAISVVYLLSTVPLILGLARADFLGWQELTWSVAALLPVSAGLLAGLHALRHVSPQRFRQILLCMVTMLGLTMIVRGLD